MSSSLGDVFAGIYRRAEWQFGSGPGSSPRNTLPYRIFLENFIRINLIKTVTDLGCGDWQFTRFVDWSGIHYTGFDVVAEIIDDNRRNFALPHIRFKLFETIGDLPGGDLLLAKEVLQHLPNATVAEYMEAIRQKYRLILVTNTCGPRGHDNMDIPVGGVRSLRLDEPPFSIRGATVLHYDFVVDGVTYHNETFLVAGC